MIREAIVVEGKRDVEAVRRAVDAECLITGGFTLSAYSLQKIEAAYRRTGIIILTDPDSAGERIRKVLSKKFPLAKHAFIPREAATANNDVGIEQATADAIRSALTKARSQEWQPHQEFTLQDIQTAGLTGRPDALNRRAAVGDQVGVGYANTKTFLRRLNNYGVTRQEFLAAVAALEANNA